MVHIELSLRSYVHNLGRDNFCNVHPCLSVDRFKRKIDFSLSNCRRNIHNFGISWQGIFLGDFFGNVRAYFSLENFSTALFSVFAATFNGLGDVFSIVLFVLVVQKLTQTDAPFSRVTHFLIFVALGGVVGPFVSAVFGVTGLTLFGFIDFNNFLFSCSHWWIGDGVLLLAPFFSRY